ncbi:hypothetical protein K7X08_025727 [Anisodus acutangulus]|uniref:Uncharacterized protein n=1 Tax=Anisodus acutangulus TaxID=402998 RepID=A0A9Q1QXE8_9SOLA|nr:hypothetical protein K7X08_025727 [Anisodus acutangulus]
MLPRVWFSGLRLTTSLVLPRRPGSNSTGPSTTITRTYNNMAVTLYYDYLLNPQQGRSTHKTKSNSMRESLCIGVPFLLTYLEQRWLKKPQELADLIAYLKSATARHVLLFRGR